MLTLRRLEVEGFGPYAERAILEFPTEPGVTVIYGDNMRGKTSLMNAIRFAFFGKVSARGGGWTGLLAACNRDLVADGRYGFVVLLAVRYEGVDYELVRDVTPKVAKPEQDWDLAESVQLRRGDGVVLGPAERTELLRRMLPEGIARFFLFDGELLAQYEELLLSETDEGRAISEAIEQILGVPFLRDARNHLATLADQANRASAKEASKHQKTSALGLALTNANNLKAAHEQERDRKKLELEQLIIERDEAIDDLRRQSLYVEAVTRLDLAKEELKRAQRVQAEKAPERSRAMSEAWRTILSEPIRQVKAKAREAASSAVETLLTSMRLEAIEQCHCGTCDQDVSEDARGRLSAGLPAGAMKVSPDQVGRLIAAGSTSDLDSFAETDVRAEVRLLSEAMRQARLDEANARGQIDDAEKILEGHRPEDLRKRSATLADLGGKIRAIEGGIEGEQREIDERIADIDRLSKNLATAGGTELVEFQRRERVLSDAKAVFTDAVDRYKALLRGRVQETATRLFLEMTTEKSDYDRLEINDHYGLSIIHRDGRTEAGRSAGAEQVVALALMGALQANAPLKGPIVMDTPFGRLDPPHTANVVKTLPSMAEQVVLLIQEGEIDRLSVRQLLGKHLLREYQLDRKSARRTLVTEAR